MFQDGVLRLSDGYRNDRLAASPALLILVTIKHVWTMVYAEKL